MLVLSYTIGPADPVVLTFENNPKGNAACLKTIENLRLARVNDVYYSRRKAIDCFISALRKLDTCFIIESGNIKLGTFNRKLENIASKQEIYDFMGLKGPEQLTLTIRTFS